MRPSPPVAFESLSLSGFKCFESTGALELRPLTLIFGRNNSGKSTLLQALLLLKQTIEAPELGPRLNTRGALYPGGSFIDLVHKHDPRKNAEFTIELQIVDPRTTIRFAFRRDPDSGAPRIHELDVNRAGMDKLVVKRGVGKGGPYELRIGERALGVERRANFVLGEARFLPLIGDEPPKVGKPNGKNRRARSGAREALRRVEQLLMDSRTVGAFRHAPRRRYEYEGREPMGPDPSGERTAQVLIADARKRRNQGELIEETNKWLRQVAKVRLDVVTLAEDIRLFELHVRRAVRGSVLVDNLADVGFGIGQALPVLVEGLRTPPGAVFLVQEPEIHLHPDAQLAMADFLVSLADRGRQVIAETHSEAVLLRVRRRIAEARSLNQNDVCFHIVDRPEPRSQSLVKTLHADELGQVQNWPAGFMEDASHERMELLSAMAAED